MLSIIYAYRNRDICRVKKSLDSLAQQSTKAIEVFLVDYGSSVTFSSEIKEVCKSYDFVNYNYCPTQHQPWNKSRALNSVIKNLASDFCFVADVDMIFHPDFVKKALQLQRTETTVYFQVGFLSMKEEVEGKKYKEFSNYRKSTSEATGLSMFPVKVLKKLRGFDEFYHFWGAEDTDMHVRIRNACYPIKFYDKDVLMLHQWHPSYRSKEAKKLTKEVQISGIVQLNHEHFNFAKKHNIAQVNPEAWGEVPSEEEIQQLKDVPVNIKLLNEKRQVDDFLYGQLPNFRNRIIKVSIKQDQFQKSLKYTLKKIAKKKVPHYYTLKQVNDKVLLHLISFYRDQPYIYKVKTKPLRIEFSIKL
mgnify:CR=1 FL=1